MTENVHNRNLKDCTKKDEEIFKHHHQAFLHKILNFICGFDGAELGRDDKGEKKNHIIIIFAQKVCS